jgi:phenylacetate-CoA ligase
LLDRAYERLPVAAQHVAVSTFGYYRRWRRRGGCYSALVDDYAARDRYSADEWAEWQRRALSRLLRIGSERPHYAERFAALGLEGADLDRLGPEDLHRLPLLAKEDIRGRPLALCPGGERPPHTSEQQTSGSTGTPLSLFTTRADDRRSGAFRHARYRSYAGVDYSLPRATLSGRRVEPDPASEGPFYRYNRAERQVYLSAHHLAPWTIAKYLTAIGRHGTVWLTGYANGISEIARLAAEQGLEGPTLRAVITIGEPLDARGREDIAAVFGARVHEEYGLVEQAAYALECERGALHVSPDVAIVEILDAEGRPCAPGESGEIVGTSFVRSTMPLIRYRTGDLATWSDRACDCGRETPVLAEVVGRLDDSVITPDGRRVNRLSHVPKGIPGLAAMQIVQTQPTALEVRTVMDDGLNDRVRKEIVRRLESMLGDGLQIDVVEAHQLERAATGKIRFVVSRLGRSAPATERRGPAA